MLFRSRRQVPAYVASAFAAFMALLAVAQPIESALHHVLVRHAVCAIHGELMHEGEEHATARARSDDSTGVSTARRQDAGKASHEHDDCTVPVIPGERALEGSRRDTLREIGTSVGTSSEPLLADAPLRSVRVYLIAPKNSPPPTRA